MPSFKKKWIIAGFLCFIMLLSNFSIFQNNFLGVNTEKLPNSKTKTETAPLISDDFDSYASKNQLKLVWQTDEDPGCWINISPAQKHSGSQSIQFYDNNNTGGFLKLRKGIGSQFSFLYVSFFARCAQTTGEWSLYISNTSSGFPYNAVDTGFDMYGTFYYGSAGSWTHQRTYTKDTWYHFEVLLDMASRIYSVYVDNSPLCDNIPLFNNLFSVNTIIFRTSGICGVGTFYLDEVVVRESFIKNQYNVTQEGGTILIDDNFNSYANNAAVQAAGWQYNTTINTSVDLTSNPLNAHSYPKSIQLFDNNATSGAFCELKKSFPRTSNVYFRTYIKPAQTNRVLTVRVGYKSGSGSGMPFLQGAVFLFRDNAMLQYYSYIDSNYHNLIGYQANQWYKIEIFASGDLQHWSFRVNDTWVGIDLPFSKSYINNFTAISFETAWGDAGKIFYVDDVFVTVNLSDSIISGTPLNGFDEKQLLNEDNNYQTIRSTNVNGKQTVAAVYQFNCSEYSQGMLEQLMLHYAYRTAANNTQANDRKIVLTSDFNDDSWTKSNTIYRTPGLMLNVHQCSWYSFAASASCCSNYAMIDGLWFNTWIGFDNYFWVLRTEANNVYSYMQMNYNNPDATRQRQYKQLVHCYNLLFASGSPGDPNGHLAITDTTGCPTSESTFSTYKKADILLSPGDSNTFHSGAVTYTHTPNYESGYLGEKYLYDMRHIAYRYQYSGGDDTWIAWEYSGIWWYWDEYYASGTAIKTFTLADEGTYKQVHNITYFASIPSGSVGLAYDAKTPFGWTGWCSTTNGTQINILASQIQVRFTLAPESSLKQITPTITGMTLTYGEPATITSTVSFYNYQSASWTPVLTKTGLGIQTLQDYIVGVGQYFNSKSILQAKVVTTTTEAPQFIFSIDRLFLNCTKPTYDLIVENQMEGGITMVVQNNTFVSLGAPYIVSYLNFPIRIAYYTKVGVNYVTSTNATLFYRINTGAWKPYMLGKDNGKLDRTILIKEGNYTTNDRLYYYLYFEQYGGQSTLLAKYYWAQNGIAANQTDARNNAFQKKVLSILTNLTLTYSVFYRSQRPVTMQTESGDNITTYPIRRIIHENFTVSFDNTSITQNKFNVRFPTEPLLNHTVEEYSHNISSTIPPYFSQAQGIKSPFTLSLDTEYTIGSQIQIPQIAYDSFLPSMNLTFSGTITTATLSEIEFFGAPLRKVLTFQNNNVTLRYDASTGIMVYFEYHWGGVNTLQTIVFALVDNNKNYTINLQIDKRWESVEEGTQSIGNQPLFIIYDPPGDHSYCELSTGTTLTYGMGIEASAGTKTYMETEDQFFGVGGGMSMSSSLSAGVETDMEVAITMDRSFTSCIEAENASFIGPGRGDLYYLVGYIVLWTVMVWNFYIVNNTADEVGHSLDDLWVWQNGSRIDYGINIESYIEELAAYLPMHGLSNLTAFNIFEDNVISPEEAPYVQKMQTLEWGPQTLTDLGYSYTTTSTVKTSLTMDFDLDIFASWEEEVKAPDIIGGETIFKSTGKVGVSFDFSFGVTATSSTETNKQIKCHLEDDDAAPIGQQDQFVMNIYRDLRYDTFGFIIYKDLTYTSRPYEPGYSKDRRLPVQCELFNVDEYLRGTETLSCAAIDEETGVFKVVFYWDIKPTLDEFSHFIDVTTQPISPNVYHLQWNTIGLHGTYYLWAEVYDNALPVWNHLASDPYIVYIDNVLPRNCDLRAYEPYREAIRLYANAFDADSGIFNVEYWDGVPEASNSTLLGISYDASSSFQYIWATDSAGTDDGIHHIYARAYDRAGNSLDSLQVEIKVVNVDNTKPTWSWVMVPNVIQNSMTTIAINVSDNTAIKKVSLHVSGSDFPYSDVAMTNIGGNVYQFSYLLTTPGTMSYCISIEDTAGNIAYVTGSFTVSAAPSVANSGLEFFLNYLLFPILLVIIMTIILVMMRSSYQKNRQKILELEKSMKMAGNLQSKDEKRSLKDVASPK